MATEPSAELLAFLDAVAAGDDNARLVFADWLQDRGDDLASLVRGQSCEWVARQFPDGMLAVCEQKDDVTGWLRFARVRYHHHPRPTVFAVSWRLYYRLMDRTHELFDRLGSDLAGGEKMTFLRVPVVIRYEQYAGGNRG